VSKFDRLAKRQKNKWLKELEEYDREKNGTNDDNFNALDEYLEEMRDGLFDDNNYYCDDYDYYDNYYDWDDWDDWDDFNPIDLDDWDVDDDISFTVKKPGTHVKDEEGNIWIGSDQLEWVNIVTGETRRRIFGQIEIVFN
jgi:hypothetical protein